MVCQVFKECHILLRLTQWRRVVGGFMLGLFLFFQRNDQQQSGEGLYRLIIVSSSTPRMSSRDRMCQMLHYLSVFWCRSNRWRFLNKGVSNDENEFAEVKDKIEDVIQILFVIHRLSRRSCLLPLVCFNYVVPCFSSSSSHKNHICYCFIRSEVLSSHVITTNALICSKGH